SDGADRALGAFARVALGHASASDYLDDRDPAVRRAAAMGTLSSYDGRTLASADALLSRLSREPDEATRSVLAIGLAAGDAPAPSRNEILTVTSRFDPEARIRDVATRALASGAPPAPWPVREVAWLRITTAAGTGPTTPMLASYVAAEGVAIPIAFDADGYA